MMKMMKMMIVSVGGSFLRLKIDDDDDDNNDNDDDEDKMRIIMMMSVEGSVQQTLGLSSESLCKGLFNYQLLRTTMMMMIMIIRADVSYPAWAQSSSGLNDTDKDNEIPR